MKDQSKTKQALIQELDSLRQRIEDLERSELEWKKKSDALKKSEAIFRSYFNLPLYGIAITSPEKGWIQVNDRLCSIMGYSRDEIVRMTWSEITHPDDIATDFEQFNRVLSGQIDYYTMNKRFIRKDGKVVWTNLSVGCVRKSDGSVDHTIAMIEDITSVKLAEAELRESENRYRRLFENANEAIFVAQDGKLVFFNPMTSQLIGYSSAELMGRSFIDFIHPDDRNMVAGNYLRRLKGEDFQPRYPFRYLPRNGATNWMEIGTVEIEWAGRPATLNFCTDITKRKQAETDLRTNEALLSTAMKLAHLGYWEYDIAGDLFTFNDYIYSLLHTNVEREGGYTMSSAQYTKRFVHLEDSSIVAREIQKAIKTSDPYFSYEVEHRIVFNDGGIGYISIHYFIVKNDQGRTVQMYGVNQDITEHKRAEEIIHQMAYHDSLTGLPNRKLFSDRLGIALAQAQRNQNKVGIAMIDLDNFKRVNDTLGHDVGDLLLQATTERLSAELRKGDTIARFGGDEFLLILPELKVIEDAIPVAKKIVDSFSKPFLIDTHELVVTTSIGIAIYPNDGIDEVILLKNADIAMYQAKQAGRNRYHLYKEA
jgi:diguanylate cyclase (GGDEF)-like protein/PAS domain S-box-containing protein